MKRDWSYLKTSLINNLKFLVLLGIGLSIIRFINVVNIQEIQIILMVLGVGLSVLGIVLYIYHSIPGLKKETANYIGQSISIDEINNFSPSLCKIGVIGLGNSGKTTLKNIISNIELPNNRTTKLSLTITITKKTPTKYIGILDGSGQNSSHQMQIAKASEVLIVLLDHNNQDSSIRINNNRINDSTNFLSLFKDFSSNDSIKFKKIILILNKKDLWNRMSNNEIKQLKNWFDQEVELIRTGNFAFEVIDFFHSNRNAKDCHKINKLIDGL